MIFNRVAGARHEAMLRAATAKALPALQILGAVPRTVGLELPSRHLGLVLAEEHAELESFVERAAEVIASAIDLDALVALARRSPLADAPRIATVPPLGQRIALARDRAFAFAYPHLLESWQRDGVELLPFSPLADEPPDDGADAVFLPGGYPELYAGQLAGATRFKAGLRQAAARQLPVYGECGGYMMLGETLIDGDGVAHEMAGLLPVTTSFANPRRRLGYRQVTGLAGPWQGTGFRAHEFHFAEELRAALARRSSRYAVMPSGMALAESGAVARQRVRLLHPCDRSGLRIPALVDDLILSETAHVLGAGMDRFFGITAQGSSYRIEILAGLTTFVTMAYILFVNPLILGETGMDKGAVFVATCLTSAFGTALMGLYANYPIALAPGMGLNAYFTYGVVIGMHQPWQVALGAVFLSGCAVPAAVADAAARAHRQRQSAFAENGDLGRHRPVSGHHRTEECRPRGAVQGDLCHARRCPVADGAAGGAGLRRHGGARCAQGAGGDPAGRARHHGARYRARVLALRRSRGTAAQPGAAVPADGSVRGVQPGYRQQRLRRLLSRFFRQYRNADRGRAPRRPHRPGRHDPAAAPGSDVRQRRRAGRRRARHFDRHQLYRARPG